MNFTWIELFYLAEYIFDHSDNLPSDEAAYRTVVNRTYYSALNMVAYFVQEVIGDNLPEDHTYHTEVNKYFKEETEISQIMESLRDKRRIADYALESQNFKDMASMVLDDFRDLMTLPQFEPVINAEN